MTKTTEQSLAQRAKLAGLRWDDDERQWTGTIDCDEPMRFWLTSAQLVSWLARSDSPAGEPAGTRGTAEQGVAA